MKHHCILCSPHMNPLSCKRYLKEIYIARSKTVQNMVLVGYEAHLVVVYKRQKSPPSNGSEMETLLSGQVCYGLFCCIIIFMPG